MKSNKVKIGQTYNMDFGWNFEVIGFKKIKIESGAWSNDTMVEGLKWNDLYGKETAHKAMAKISELKE